MNRYLPIIIICFLIVTSGCVSVTNSPEDCKKISDSEERDICLSNLAGKQKNISICNMIEGEKARDFCFPYVAVRVPDPDLCEQAIKKYKYLIRTTKKLISKEV